MNDLIQQKNEIAIQQKSGMSFQEMLKASEVLASSNIIPKEFQAQPGNCFVVLQLANRLEVDPFTMLQNVDVVYGRPGIRGSFARALVQSKTRGFVSDGFEVEGKLPATFKNFKADSSDFQLRYFVEKASPATGEIVKVFGPWIGPALAESMGWWSKNGSFWSKNPSMCERMCKFRAVSWYVRDEDPNILAGIPLSEELHDYDAIDVTPTKEPTAAQKAFKVASPEEEEEAPVAEEKKKVTTEAQSEDEIWKNKCTALKHFAHECGYKLTETIPAIVGREITALSDLSDDEWKHVEAWLDKNRR